MYNHFINLPKCTLCCLFLSFCCVLLLGGVVLQEGGIVTGTLEVTTGARWASLEAVELGGSLAVVVADM